MEENFKPDVPLHLVADKGEEKKDYITGLKEEIIKKIEKLGLPIEFQTALQEVFNESSKLEPELGEKVLLALHQFQRYLEKAQKLSLGIAENVIDINAKRGGAQPDERIETDEEAEEDEMADFLESFEGNIDDPDVREVWMLEARSNPAQIFKYDFCEILDANILPEANQFIEELYLTATQTDPNFVYFHASCITNVQLRKKIMAIAKGQIKKQYKLNPS